MKTRLNTGFLRASIVAISAICGAISPCRALLTSEAGNKELSAANYTDWPGLVEAINDKSRVHQVWWQRERELFLQRRDR